MICSVGPSYVIRRRTRSSFLIFTIDLTIPLTHSTTSGWQLDMLRIMRVFLLLQVMVMAVIMLCSSTIGFSPSSSFLQYTGSSDRTHRFATPTCRPFKILSPLHFSGDDDNDPHDDEKKKKFSSIDELLDKPFFDPDAYDDSDKSLLGRLASFVKSDYELAETLYVGMIFVILVIISQEILRMQLYGSNYVPFHKSVISGRLF